MSETVVWLTREPTEEYIQWVREEGEIKLILWPGGAVALP